MFKLIRLIVEPKFELERKKKSCAILKIYFKKFFIIQFDHFPLLIIDESETKG